ncbi:hypothetical protein M501DRAFT_925473 [Patellaria atrata CBS 101060]|uniref:Uncharacterized protein n=1 Tax=Patellaria atrata CBS 101060 TaxID=1346257 RepID=A0A9P4SKX0_9PEZI|nr:hypothetical protein M501DRAFT_925473 [Patellaria atrata CBS 101060]
MPHVLEILAYLHHMELISDQIYSDNPNRDLLALRQPPALHLLSSQIFTSLSDAAWNAHETAAQKAKSSQVVQYDWIGREIPGSRYKVQVSSLGPEIWLELVLWSCLYGGWISEGAEIIAKLKQSSGEKRWSLICWRDMLAAVENPGNQIPDKAYRDRKLVEKTISSEVVAAYVDALLNDIRINVGARGMAPQIALDHIRNLKRFLDAQNMSLAPTSWGAVVSRYLDWEGVVLERAPSLASLALRLLPAFREEIESINVSPNGALSESTSYYTFEPSAAPLGLLNRTLNGFVEKGDINGLLTGFDRLQKYTDVNKRRSLEVLLSRARSSTQDGRDLVKGVFDSNLDASQFPAFYPQIPPHILSSIMDLITSSKAYEFGRWLLYSTDIDGPIIPDSMYNNAKIAKSLITFAFASGDKQLFAKILDRQKLTTGENNEKISNEVLLALLESQISSRDWGSVQNLLKYMGQSPTGWNVTAAVLLARELLRLESEISLSGNEEKEQSFSQVKELFRFLVQNGYGNVEKGGHLTITSILGFLACTNREWAIFSSTLRSRSTAQAVSMSTQQFNILLEGAVQRAGSGEGTRLVKMWSRDIMPPSPESGGLVTLPATRPKHHNEVDSLSPLEIDACIESHEPFLFYGRVETDLSTLRIILSAFIKENIDGMEQRNVGNYQLQEDLKMFNWLRKKMKAFGLTATEIEHEVDGIIAIEARKSTVSRKVGP